MIHYYIPHNRLNTINILCKHITIMEVNKIQIMKYL